MSECAMKCVVCGNYKAVHNAKSKEWNLKYFRCEDCKKLFLEQAKEKRHLYFERIRKCV